MHASFITFALTATTLTLLSPIVLAHGGIYRGPAQPAVHGPIGPHGRVTAQPTALDPAEPTAAKPKHRGPQFAEDLSTWQYWWECNKHAYLNLRREVHRIPNDDGFHAPRYRPQANLQLAPTHEQIHQTVLPALKRTIDASNQRDTVSSCLIAMAKIGQDHEDFALVDVFAAKLQVKDQEIRETAALAMGISAVASKQARNHLINLSLDSAAGRKLTGGNVRNRTRAFALYGLGLSANQHLGATIQRRALQTMRTVLEDENLRNRNLKVAAIHGMGLLPFDRKDAAGLAMLDEALDSLHRYYTMPADVGTQFTQSNCPAAIAKLLGRDHARLDSFCQLFAQDLKGENKERRCPDLARSAVLALGQLCKANSDEDSPDRRYRELLAETAKSHKDNQTRFFALLALGQIGGERNQQLLLRVLETENKHEERPWAAIALGVQAFASHQAQLQKDAVPQPQSQIGEALTRQLEKAKRPELIGALGIALGLTRHLDAADLMRKRMLANLASEQQAGYLGIGLGMMRDLASIEALENTVKASSRRTWLLVQASTALGLLGDKAAAAGLHKVMGNPNTPVATFAAAAIALGDIGDLRAIGPLKHRLLDEQLTDLQRAFAAVSLGGIADPAMFPWHAKISTNINYRAAVETLTDRQSGVLDIL